MDGLLYVSVNKSKRSWFLFKHQTTPCVKTVFYILDKSLSRKIMNKDNSPYKQ